MKSKTLAITIAVFAAMAMTVQAQRIITFDAPGAGTGAFQGTTPIGINRSGTVAGYYTDSNNVSHGFLRDSRGKFTSFDPPGSGTEAGLGTSVLGLNDEGAVVGAYVDNGLFVHGFLRRPDGRFKTVDSPAACTTNVNSGCHGSGAWDINFFGIVVGAYEDTSGNFVAHTFVRSPDGKFTTFAVPGSSMQAGQGTLPASLSGLNDFGAITGLYYDANNIFHGYLRSPDGKFTDFEAPDAGTSTAFSGTFPNSLNDFGAITGEYEDANSVYHGFLRNLWGKFTEFDAPGANTTADSFAGTFPQNINLSGVITGYFLDANSVYHGFSRDPWGGFTTFDAPGADMTGDYGGTFPLSSNDAGATTGYYGDTNSVNHGFVRLPK